MQKSHFASALGVGLIAGAALFAVSPQHVTSAAGEPARLSLPLIFEPNWGQDDAPVLFSAAADSGRVFLTARAEAAMLFGSGDRAVAVRMRPVGGTPAPAFGERRGPGVSSYFRGNDPSQWQTAVPHYEAVRYPGVYPGIDFVYYGNGRALEYDAVVSPGAEPASIVLEFDGVEGIRIDREGQLLLHTAVGDVVQPPPISYQVSATGERQYVASRYVIRGPGRVGFDLGAYDSSRTVVIDPTLIYGTYLGGTGSDTLIGIALDDAGNIYVTGSSTSADFPTVGGLQPSIDTGTDLVVAKLNSSGTAILWSTYLGGDGFDGQNGMMPIAVDSTGNVFVVAMSGSTDFPVVNAFQPTRTGISTDAVVVKIAASGTSLLYSTYLGGTNSDIAAGVALDSFGRAYVTGQTSSTDFPTLNPLQPSLIGGGDAFVTVFEPSGTSVLYSTYLGGNGGDQPFGIALDPDRNAYIVGYTGSTNYPTVGPIHGDKGGSDGFLTKINASGSALIYSTYLGGDNEDLLRVIALDSSGAAYVTGNTMSSNYPVVGAFQPTFGGGNSDAMVSKVNPAGNALVFSSYLGGAVGEFNFEQGLGIAVDAAGFTYVSGHSNAPDFPLVNSLPYVSAGGQDAFLVRINPAGNILTYSTLLTGTSTGFNVAVKPDGTAYVTGDTSSPDLAVLSAFQATLAGGSDGFIMAVSPFLVPVANDQMVFTNEDTPIDVTLTATDPNGVGLQWFIVTGPANGVLTGVPPDLTYSPNTNFSGPFDSFQFQVDDGLFPSNVATITVDVQNDQAPLPVDDSFTTDVDVPLVLQTSALLTNDIDPGPLTVTSVGAAQNGATDRTGTQVTYTPNPGFFGSDTFPYVVRNLAGLSGVASVHVTVAKVEGIPDFVNAMEDAPVAIQAIELLANDVDADGDTLSITAVSAPVNGTVSLVANTITFAPSINFNGAASFSYTVSDGTMTDLTSVSVTVFPVNDPPSGAANSLNATEDMAASITAATLLANDSDVDGDLLTVVAVGPAMNGDVSLSGTTITYTPDPDFSGADAFTYVVRDPGGLTADITVNVSVAATPDAPRANTESLGMDEDTVASFPSSALTANDADPDGDALTVTAVSNAVSGTVSLISGTVTFTPYPDFSGMGSFTYTVSDGSLFATGFVLVNVSALNDAPAAALDVYSTLEDVPIAFEGDSLLSNDGDVDGDALTLESVSASTGGNVVLSAGTITFTPDQGFRGAARFTYVVSDGTLTSTGDVTVFVLPVNHAPGAPVSASPGPDVSTLSPALSVMNATDPDGDLLELEFEIDTTPTFDSTELQTSGAIPQSGGATTDWQVPAPLLEDTVYFWRVRSNDGFLASDWDLSSFFVSSSNDPPGAPHAISPTNDALLDDRLPTLIVQNATDPEGDTLTYDFELRKGDTESEVVLSMTGVTEGTVQTLLALADPLKRGKSFVWIARAVDAGGVAGPFSAPAAFSIYKEPADETGACSVSSASRGHESIALGLMFVAIMGTLRRQRRELALS